MIDLNALPMRAAVGQFDELSDEQIAFALKCGVQNVLLNTPKLPGDEYCEFKDLRTEAVDSPLLFHLGVPLLARANQRTPLPAP